MVFHPFSHLMYSLRMCGTIMWEDKTVDTRLEVDGILTQLLILIFNDDSGLDSQYMLTQARHAVY